MNDLKDYQKHVTANFVKKIQHIRIKGITHLTTRGLILGQRVGYVTGHPLLKFLLSLLHGDIKTEIILLSNNF